MRTRHRSRKIDHRFRTLAVAAWLVSSGAEATTKEGSVISTIHNLSVGGPGEIKAQSEREVCKFCHVPHNPVVRQPLWGHALSEVKSYATAPLRSSQPGAGLSPQPDGSSRFCLSCHDGTVALGDLGRGRKPIVMGKSERLGPGRKGYIGTDLSGSHPISIVVPESEPLVPGDHGDIGLRPLSVIVADADVRLDAGGKMQCTTCHDPHADRYYQPGRVPHFWNKPTITEVCTACHELR